jgi:endoglucanase
VDRHRDSDWGSGWCETVTVTNKGTSAADWSLSLAVGGTVDKSWNCAMSGKTGTVTVSGVDFNRHLAPGGTAQFGMCASK